MKIQMTRSDWEKAGPYQDCKTCPAATMMSRVLGHEVHSMGWDNYYNPWTGGPKGKTRDFFNWTTYQEAERRYNAGEEVLFETTLIQ